MFLINNLEFPLDFDFNKLSEHLSRKLKINKISFSAVYKKSVDARKKNNIHFCCSVLIRAENEAKILKRLNNAKEYNEQCYIWPKTAKAPTSRPVVVGFGPAGMFAALSLARAGLSPLVLERGTAVEKRTNDVARFFSGEKLCENSNVQFGEGGAGTFSDGKLNTGINDHRCRAVLEEFVKHGAPSRIMTDAKPHIGTDILVSVVKSIRNEIISLGGEIRFEAKLDEIIIKNGAIRSVISNREEIPCNTLILATGHSARDTFQMLYEKGIHMEKKPFSVGVRIEHLQSDINRALYGEFADHSALGAADYKLAVHLPSGRGVYTFCMCPGGEVINSSSEQGGIAVNGMSKSLRNGTNANSALLVGINPEDFNGETPLAGCEFQRKVEQAAFNIAKGSVPVSTVGSFVFGESFKITKVKPTVKPDYAYSNFEALFPSFVIQSLKEGILAFDKKIKGFADKSAVLSAPETRSSSPVRITRNENGQSVNTLGLYPCGEGAGYAGGIMSAAVDGLKSAERLIEGII